MRITHVFETHIHNDYVTGGYALAARTGAAYHVNADDPVSFERVPTRDGDVIAVGDSMRVRAVHTPGHTFTHLSFVLEGDEPAVFSGGSLLFGSTGRPDLLGAEHAPALAHHQYASAHTLAELPDETAVLPTHGFGSFCSATATTEGATGSTIGQERRVNPALTQDEEVFVETILAGLDDHPAYYVHMAPRNLAGPDEPDLSLPSQADKSELRRRLEAGEWLVDLRTRTAFAAGHVPGTINVGLDGQFATYLGWIIPWGTPLTLLGATADEVAEAQRHGRPPRDQPAQVGGELAVQAEVDRARHVPGGEGRPGAQVHEPLAGVQPSAQFGLVGDRGQRQVGLVGTVEVPGSHVHVVGGVVVQAGEDRLDEVLLVLGQGRVDPALLADRRPGRALGGGRRRAEAPEAVGGHHGGVVRQVRPAACAEAYWWCARVGAWSMPSRSGRPVEP